MLVTLACCWLGWHIHTARRQQEAVKTIRDYGGWVLYDYELNNGKYDPTAQSWVPKWAFECVGPDFFHSEVEINFYEQPPGKAYSRNPTLAPLEQLAYLPKVERLTLYDTQASDANLRHVGKLRHLRSVGIYNAHLVTDAGVAYLGSMRKLQSVFIERAQLTDRSLEVFSRSTGLQELIVPGGHFTDAGVAHLQGLQDLRCLDLTGRPRRINPISDKTLAPLLDLPDFQLLGVFGTDVSEEFRRKMKARFPQCVISPPVK